MNSFPSRRRRPIPHLLSEFARLLDLPPPAKDVEILGVAPLALAGPEDLGFLAHRRYLSELMGSRAGALLVSRQLEALLEEDPRPRLVAEDAHGALAILLEAIHPPKDTPARIHSTAVVGDDVSLGRDVHVAPYAVLEEGVQVGDESWIGAHCVVGRGSRIGDRTILHPHVVVYPGAVIGDGVILHSGARIGVDGFGYVFEDGRHRKIPHPGACVLEDDVEIGANTTIDRGSIGETRVGEGAKLDNLVQLGHNVTVGPHSVLAGQAGVGGSTRIGRGVMVGGQAGLGGHISIGDGARLAGQAGVTRDVEPGGTVMGFPARERREFLRTVAAQGKVPELLGRVRRIEERLAELLDREDTERRDPG